MQTMNSSAVAALAPLLSTTPLPIVIQSNRVAAFRAVPASAP